MAKCITEKKLKYFSDKYKKIINLGKLYQLSKSVENVLARPLTPNSGKSTEKYWSFWIATLKRL